MNDGGPAFPHDGQANYTGGMSLRDWFAGQAMAAMVGCYTQVMRGVEAAQSEAESDMGQFARNTAIDMNSVTGKADGAEEIASDAYIIADAMLAARETTQGKDSND